MLLDTNLTTAEAAEGTSGAANLNYLIAHAISPDYGDDCAWHASFVIGRNRDVRTDGYSGYFWTDVRTFSNVVGYARAVCNVFFSGFVF